MVCGALPVRPGDVRRWMRIGRRRGERYRARGSRAPRRVINIHMGRGEIWAVHVVNVSVEQNQGLLQSLRISRGSGCGKRGGAKILSKSRQNTCSNELETSLYHFKHHFGKMLSCNIYFHNPIPSSGDRARANSPNIEYRNSTAQKINRAIRLSLNIL